MKKPFYKHLYFYVLLAIAAGIVLGIAFPGPAKKMKIFNDVFIRIIRMIVAPVIFLTVTLGITHLKDFKKAGRIGLKAILYFELVTTFALLLGLLVVNLLKPGEGMNINLAAMPVSDALSFIKKDDTPFIYKIIPSSIFQPFIDGEILQILFLAILTGASLTTLGETGRKITHYLELFSQLAFRMVSYVMLIAPLGAFGAMAFTVAENGPDTLVKLGKLMGCVYLTCILFILLVLGSVAMISGFSLPKFLNYIRQEIFFVLATSSSESVLPQLIEKMERLGCSRTVTRLVIPTGYSFNLDGTSIYLTMSAVFIAQACNIKLSLGDQLLMTGIFMLTSKGAAAVTGGGLVTLAGTLSMMDVIPLAALRLVVGIDRFMSEARAITNLIGNAVATMAIARWEKEIDKEKMKKELKNEK